MSSKISALTDGNPVVGTDILPYARGAGNVRGTTDELADYIALITIAEVFEGALQVNAATTAVLAGSPTYANGAAGVGATLTKGSNGAFPSQDGVASVAGNRYLVKNQAAALQNGVYELTTLGTAGTPWVLTRTTDSDLNTELDAQIVIPGAGTVNKRFVFNQTTALPTIGTSSIVYAQTSATAGLGIPLTRTVAQMQALIAGAGLTRGRGYFITGMAAAQFVTCSAYFVATSTTTISSMGWCPAFENLVSTAAVEMEVEYTITTDEITELYCPASRNRMGANAVDTAGLYNFPFDSATIFDNNMRSISSCAIDPAANLTRAILSAGATILMEAGSTFQGFCAPGGGINLAGTATYTGTIGAGATLSMYGTQSLTNCTIGDGKTADFTVKIIDSYTRVGRTYAGSFSDFDLSAADLVGNNNLDMALNTGIIDMINFPWVGIIKVSGDEGQKLLEFTNYPTDHSWTVIPNNSAGIAVLIASKPFGSTNIYLETNTFITLQGAANPVDRAVFQADEQDNTMVVKIGGANYVI